MDVKQKEIAIQSLYEKAKSSLKELLKIQKEARERANEAEGAMQSRYDTFKEEGQYLANALKIRCEEAKKSVLEIEKTIKTVNFDRPEKVRLFAYVQVEFEDNEERKSFFIFPAMGGEKILDNITVVTPSSPIGRVLIGKEAGDEFSFIVGGKKKKGEILEVK